MNGNGNSSTNPKSKNNDRKSTGSNVELNSHRLLMLGMLCCNCSLCSPAVLRLPLF